MNDHSIGICAEGSYMTETMPEAQKQSIVDLCRYIKGKYTIKRIGGHKEFYETDCPGTNYPLQQIKDLVASTATVAPKTVPTPTYEETVPTGPNIFPMLGSFYIEKRSDGGLGIHLDRENYITLFKGNPPVAYWNDNKGNGGSKTL